MLHLVLTLVCWSLDLLVLVRDFLHNCMSSVFLPCHFSWFQPTPLRNALFPIVLTSILCCSTFSWPKLSISNGFRVCLFAHCLCVCSKCCLHEMDIRGNDKPCHFYLLISSWGQPCVHVIFFQICRLFYWCVLSYKETIKKNGINVISIVFNCINTKRLLLLLSFTQDSSNTLS